MAIAAEYERDEWESNGGWRGVEDYVDAVTLFFADDDVIDDHEETPETRSEVAYPDGRVEVKVTRHRCYRAFYREGPYTWQQEDSGERDFTDYYLTHRDTPAAPTPEPDWRDDADELKWLSDPDDAPPPKGDGHAE